MLKVFCDGGARGNPGPAASAIVVFQGRKVLIKKSQYLGIATNNVSEYKAVIMGLEWLSKNLIDESFVYFILDSELVVKQLSGIFKIKNENLRNLFFTVKNLEKKMKAKIVYKSVPRLKNRLADFLVNKTLDENE